MYRSLKRYPDSSHEITHSTPLSHEKEFFSSADHVGVVINTDGVAIFKSSLVTMWPIYFEIVNVPPAIQFREDNTVICGIWVGKSKPDMRFWLSSTLESIDMLNIMDLNSFMLQEKRAPFAFIFTYYGSVLMGIMVAQPRSASQQSSFIPPQFNIPNAHITKHHKGFRRG